jgi:hypothetical protein
MFYHYLGGSWWVNKTLCTQKEANAFSLWNNNLGYQGILEYTTIGHYARLQIYFPTNFLSSRDLENAKYVIRQTEKYLTNVGTQTQRFKAKVLTDWAGKAAIQTLREFTSCRYS